MKPLSDYFRNIFGPDGSSQSHGLKKNPEHMWIVFMGTFPPRACGIATFTSDLVNYFDAQFVPIEETKIIAMNRGSGPDPAAQAQNGTTTDLLTGLQNGYSEKVTWQIYENNSDDYVRVARELNDLPQVKIISIQHEFGIYGENDGERILLFLKEIQKPVAVTFHTVLPNPSENQKRITCEIVNRADRLIVMTQTSKSLLESVYGAATERIKVIPHGIHPRPYSQTDIFKPKFSSCGFEGRRVISTFGLLGRGKGIEFGIEAMPEIVKRYPDALYAVIGATHPVVLQNEGPVYIDSLREKVRELGMEHHVVFIDRYVETSELLEFLQATDVYLSLSQNPDQAVSGTLTYALGMGRPVISTPFSQAKEIVTSELGILAEFNDSASIANAVIALFDDPARLDWMSRTAYFRTRSMTWSNVALSYMREFKKLSHELALKEKSIPPVKLDHMRRMTDDFGMFQFAILADPDPASGYTIDDNARAMVVACWFARLQKGIDSTLFDLAGVYLNFLSTAMREDGGFNNYFDVNRNADMQRNYAENLEDANARAIWSLAELAVACTPDAEASYLVERAKHMFKKQLEREIHIKSPRAMGFHIKAISLWLKIEPDDSDARNRIIELAEILADLYRRSQHEGWRWFEESLTYSNGLLSEAMFFAHRTTGNEEYKKIAMESLDFLIENSFDGEMCVPVGQGGWFKLGGKKPLYDQQPEEVSALVLALQTAYDIVIASGDDGAEDAAQNYLHKKELAFDWFLGNNILEQVVYSEMSGGCYDGLGEGYINLNQGAESTTAYLLARAVM
jgi:glycosyltransferase involved in cell wall biosynthesis